jgi:hypothetical protein
MGERNLFNKLGQTASPYAYSLAGANAAAIMDDKWFCGARPNYANVSMAAIANTVGRQFGEKAENWLASDNHADIVTNFDPEEYLTLEAMRSKTRPLLVKDYSQSQRSAIRDISPTQLPVLTEYDSNTGKTSLVETQMHCIKLLTDK